MYDWLTVISNWINYFWFAYFWFNYFRFAYFWFNYFRFDYFEFIFLRKYELSTIKSWEYSLM